MKPMPPVALCASCFRLPWICSYSRSISSVTEARVSPSAVSNSAIVTVAGVDRAAQRVQAGAADEILQVGAGEALAAAGERIEIDVVGERHPLGVDAENAPPPVRVGHRHVDQFVEPAGAKQGRIDQIRPVGRADHDHRLQFLEPVHLGEDGVDHALGDLRLAHAAAARRNEAVELVDEDHGRRDLAGAGEQAGDLLLASPYHLESRSELLVAMKFASASRAVALASRVLPVPGGP